MMTADQNVQPNGHAVAPVATAPTGTWNQAMSTWVQPTPAVNGTAASWVSPTHAGSTGWGTSPTGAGSGWGGTSPNPATQWSSSGTSAGWGSPAQQSSGWNVG
jgi:DNA-directed RNA polymerase II subunit RPB3